MPVTQGIDNPQSLRYVKRKSVREFVPVDPAGIEGDFVFSGIDYLSAGTSFSGNGAVPTKGYAGNVYTVSTTGDTSHYFRLGNLSFQKIYKGVTIELAAAPVINTAGNRHSLGILIAKDANNYISIAYNFSTGSGTVHQKNNGTLTTPSLSNGSAPSGTIAKIHIGFGCNHAYLWAENTGGTVYYIGYVLKAFDFASIANQNAGIKVNVSVSSNAASSNFKIARIVYGGFGLTGFSNPRIITYSDGNPYTRGNYVYVVGSTPMGGGTNAVWGDFANSIFKVNISDLSYEKVGTVLLTRNGGYTCDCATQVVYDEVVKKFRVIASSWSSDINGTLLLAYGATTANLLSGVNAVNATLIPAFDSGYQYYDPAIIFTNGFWYLACSRYQGAYKTVVYKTTDFVSFSQVWADSQPVNYEGSTICRFNNVNYVFTVESGGTGVRINNLITGAFKGSFTHPAGHSFAAGHFAIFPVMKYNKTFYQAITHYGTFKWGGYDFGDYVAFSVVENEDGFEYEPSETIKANQPTLAIAKRDVLFSDLIFDLSNIDVIFRVRGIPESFKPDFVNSIQGFEKGNGYLFNVNEDIILINTITT